MADHWPGAFPNVNIYRRTEQRAHLFLCLFLSFNTTQMRLVRSRFHLDNVRVLTLGTVPVYIICILM